MTRRLTNQTRGLTIADRVEIASSFGARLKGLLGRDALPEGEALWIERCTSIHTCFMRFAIDVVFIDERMVVRRIHENVGPWRVTWPAFSAKSVIEMPAGTVRRKHVEIGDQLHVGD